MVKKVKTSVTIHPATLKQIKAIAKREERSVSYVLERFIRACIEVQKSSHKSGGTIPI